MGVVDLDRLLQDISPEAPSGEKDLEYDPVFMALEEKLRPEKVRSDPPDWHEIRESGFELLTRVHDLRIAVTLTRALLHTEGLPGFRDGLSLLCGLVELYWDTLYPQPDRSEGNDPSQRINILEALNDWETVIAPLMRLELCSSRAVGSFSLRDYRIATGKVAELAVSKEEEKDPPGLANIEGAFGDTDLASLQANREAAGASLESVKTLAALIGQKAGQEMAPDFQKLRHVLKELHDVLTEQLARRTPYEPASTGDEGGREDSEKAAPEGVVQGNFAQGGRKMDGVKSRKDVLQLLDQICAYYERNEPASPVPLLLKRATRLVEKNFLEIIEDLAPDSVSQIRNLGGVREEKP